MLVGWIYFMIALYYLMKKTEKTTYMGFDTLFYKNNKFWSISLDYFIKINKLHISEEFSSHFWFSNTTTEYLNIT